MRTVAVTLARATMLTMMPATVLATMLTTVLAAPQLGCSERHIATTRNDGDVPRLDASNLARESARLLCEPMSNCCAQWGWRYQQAQCVASLQANFENVATRIDLGEVLFDSVAGRQCLTEVRDAMNECRFEVPQSCRAALTGTLGERESCTDALECENPRDGYSLCDEQAGCRFRPRAFLGDDCSSTCAENPQFSRNAWPLDASPGCHPVVPGSATGDCHQEDGLHCADETRRCEPLHSDGDECAAGSCGPGLRCVEGTCRPHAAEGEPCEYSGRSPIDPDCAEGLRCDEDDVCRRPEPPQPPFGASLRALAACLPPEDQ